MASPDLSRRSIVLGMCALTAVDLTGLFEISPAQAASAVKVRADVTGDVKTGKAVRGPAQTGLAKLPLKIVKGVATVG